MEGRKKSIVACAVAIVIAIIGAVYIFLGGGKKIKKGEWIKEWH